MTLGRKIQLALTSRYIITFSRKGKPRNEKKVCDVHAVRLECAKNASHPKFGGRKKESPFDKWTHSAGGRQRRRGRQKGRESDRERERDGDSGNETETETQ